MTPRVRVVERFDIDVIHVGARLRQAKPETVQHICDSFKVIGQRMPITVRMSDPHDPGAYPILVTGLHRLEAARLAGMDTIEAFVSDDDDADKARLWEISENLHRADLTKLERDEQILEWIRITDKIAQLEQFSKVGAGRGNEGGISAAARDLGMSRMAVDRAVKVAGLTQEAKASAKETGLDDNQSALLEAAKAPIQEQASVIRQIAATKAARLAADPVDDFQAMESQVARLMSAWNAAGPDARQEFMLRIDQYVKGSGCR